MEIVLLLLGLLAPLLLCSPIKHADPGPRQVGPIPRGIQGNTSSLPADIPWHGYDLNTNYYKTTPETNVVREYWFDIVNTTAALDGVERSVLLVNGQFPGPTIEANWGDIVKVHVTNRMQDNGTAIHFHGIRQLYNNQMDGVAALTQCPVPPNSSYTYVWRAEAYGSSWYHSHFSLQAWEGVFGGIVIHGPAAAEYDHDLGVLFLNDWSHQTVDEMYQSVLESPNPPHFQTGLINGSNIWTNMDNQTVGRRFQTEFVPGQRYRIRLVNAAMHTHFKFSIDNHDLTVIANDFVPIVPFTTNNVPIGMGERYDIVVTANQNPDNYWIRAIPQSFCSDNSNPDNIRGILHYKGAADDSDPTSSKWDYGDDIQCLDFSPSELVPWLALDADIGGAQTVASDVDFLPFGDVPLYLWTLGGNALNISWNDPTLQQTFEDPDKMNWTANQGVIEAATAYQWTVLVIQTDIPVPHPIHLHGHDFYVLAQGFGRFSPQNVTLKTTNPPRRDTALMIASEEDDGGFLVIAFPADNPGVWLIHCHIGFHATEGFAQQIVERQNDFNTFFNADLLENTCAAWDEYAKVNPYGNQYRGLHGPYESGI
ncbi:extracellular dihydrogeodin oxidase/laccase [Aspergillus ibericus CBS 121593]|uniref:Extracellular dihydrogeodin oxidase/laccase n=1 Tax=Aspergillus ibericus CBS 121593 TaxID=1448316 RepID=A0A395H7M4_9EURO|nr:extracellular dihydrogeodin oxidase/laccase [Aspergillus ibericus CBS 121593]RAL03917.1 extracellular dihydrogeodin oxidase/laccase [Aspergillus ibericus CBS 121593]